MNHAHDRLRILTALMAVFPLLLLPAVAQENKATTYAVGRGAMVSVTNNYGTIAVKPSRNRQVVVSIASRSDAVSLVHEQHGNRIELRSISTGQGIALVDYKLLVPADASVRLQSSEGSVRVEGLCGDIILEVLTGSVEANDIIDAHLHVKTLSGPISLTGIRNSHLDVRSNSGSIRIQDATGSSVEVRSVSGRITYEGDPGHGAEYLLISHSGDLDVSIPARSLVEIRSHSVAGKMDQYLPKADDGSPTVSMKLLKQGLVGSSRFVLRSYRGNIYIRRP